MHVHLDGKGLLPSDRRSYPMALMQLWRTHLIFENVMISFLPFSRRRNEYCRPLSEAFKLSELELVESLIEAEKMWYKEITPRNIARAKGSHYHPSRYFGLNLNPLFSQRHLEIRLHNGTLNERKILEWANLNALMVDAAVAGEFTDDFLDEALATSNVRDKTNMLFKNIGLAESSRKYFYDRQHKFDNKKTQDEDVFTNN